MRPLRDVAYTDYILRIQPGIRYQPHLALAVNAGWQPRLLAA